MLPIANGRVLFQIKRVRDFYTPHVGEAAEPLLEQCGIGTDRRSGAKSVLLQAKRLVELADAMLTIKQNRDALALFWYVICAESVSKIESAAPLETGSGAHVRRFFQRLVPTPDRNELTSSFVDSQGRTLGLGQGVAALYRVRCTIAHDGEYWDFQFPRRGESRQISADVDVHTTISRDRLRRLLLVGAVNAAHRCAEREARSSAPSHMSGAAEQRDGEV